MSDFQLDEQYSSDTTPSNTTDTLQTADASNSGVDHVESVPRQETVATESDDNLGQDGAFEDNFFDKIQDHNEGDIVTARVRVIKKSGVLVDFSYKSDGFIPTNELSDALQSKLEEGIEIQALIQKLETKEGYSLLSEKLARAELIWDDLFDLMTKKTVVRVQIKKPTNKGYTVFFDQVTGFLHQEEGDDFSEKDTVDAVIAQVDKRRKKVWFSTRNIQTLLSKKKAIQNFFDTVSSGDEVEGVVSCVKKFGAFVSIDGAEGLVHISEISWRRITHPSHVLSVGDTVKVKVLSIDKDSGRLSLSIKQLTLDPWETVEDDLSIGDMLVGEIVRVIDFGAFVLLKNNIEGLIHISEVSSTRIESLPSILNVGDKVNVKVIKISKDDQRLGLSMKNIDQNEDVTRRLNANEN